MSLVSSVFHRVDDYIRSIQIKNRIRPSFVIIGAQKAGTSSLFHYITQHPSIANPKTKEIHYYDKNFDKGLRWYLGQFPRINKGEISGEASPFYLFHPSVPERLKEAFPEIKIIAVLRNPVERAYSHYQMEVRRKRENLTFEEAIEREISVKDLFAQGSDFFQHKTYLSRGLYDVQIKRWLEHFPLDQFLFIPSSILLSNPEKVMDDVFKFLSVDSIKIPDLKSKHVGNYPEISDDLQTKLELFFKESNHQVQRLLGDEFRNY